MSDTTDVLIIGAGSSGLGTAIQLIREYGLRSFEIVEKAEDVGGTWLANTYPGCGCDVASHLYSFSFALNPDWTYKYSLQSEIQQYFRDLTERYALLQHIRFQSAVQSAIWDEKDQSWRVTIQDMKSKQTYIRQARIVVSAVGAIGIPKPCQISGAESFSGPLFHSAQWDHTFDYDGKMVVVIGNGCSATQFVPVMAKSAGRIVQFARQAHYLAERPNPQYSSAFRTLMKYFPGAMRLYRAKLFADIEKDFAGFYIESGLPIRDNLKAENERYVKRMAPQRYWDALIPKHQIGCKRKVMDTDYLATLHRENVELIHDDPVEKIHPTGVETRSGRKIEADAIILATGFEVHRMLFPMKIIGENGTSLSDFWDKNHGGAAQAYFGTSIPGFKNFFTLMGPNTLTGHNSVLFAVECQVNYMLRLVDPILRSAHSRNLLSSTKVVAVNVKNAAAERDQKWTQSELKNLVWSSGCTSWALDPKTGLNIAMYPDWQVMYWWRSIFIRSEDFEYTCDSKKGRTKRKFTIGGWKTLENTVLTIGVLAGASYGAHRLWLSR